jgi:hypothetical protein
VRSRQERMIPLGAGIRRVIEASPANGTNFHAAPSKCLNDD